MSLDRRLGKLEERTGEGPAAVKWPGEPVVLNGEEMTQEEFACCYPDGHLIIVVYEETETP